MALFNQLVGQANSANYLTPTGITSNNTIYTVATSTGTTLGQLLYGGTYNAGTSNNNVNAVFQNHPYIPPPSGQQTTIAFMDANGMTWALQVDANYATLMQQISTHHYSAQNYSIKPAPVMVDNEFSYDEMEKAELLIEEMNADKENA